MTLHAETAARTRAAKKRLATYSKNHCPQCGEWLLAPDWSEYFNERCVRQASLEQGDRVRVGGFTFVVYLHGGAAEGEPSLYQLFKTLPPRRLAS